MKAALAALVGLLALPSAVVAEPSVEPGPLVFVKGKNLYAYDVGA
jgi:hypothetical protein